MRSLTGRAYSLLLAALLGAIALGAVVLPLVAPAGPIAMAGILVGILALVALAAYPPLRSLDRRFDSIAQCAREMASGRSDARAPVDAHDELALLARSLNDLADRHQARLRELHAERDAGQAILGHVPLGLALLGRNLTIRHANARFWHFMGLEPPSGPVRLAAARQPALEEMALDAMRRGERLTRDLTFYLGEPHEYEIRMTPIGSSSGRPEALLLSIEDLSPERAMAALRREFVANASHELKTPLTSIRGYAETLLAGGLEDESNRARFVETIRAQASRLESLVEDLLELADLERPDAPLDRKDWDLGEIARDMAETFDEIAARRGLRLRIEARPGLRARVDRKRIELALGNLLDNAIKYTEQGEITVRVEPSGSAAARISVSDSGKGISAEHLPRIFERFYRVDRGRSRALGGTGLGLSIVKHVVQLHAGRTGVESRLGEGSTFWFDVPRDPTPGAVT